MGADPSKIVFCKDCRYFRRAWGSLAWCLVPFLIPDAWRETAERARCARLIRTSSDGVGLVDGRRDSMEYCRLARMDGKECGKAGALFVRRRTIGEAISDFLDLTP